MLWKNAGNRLGCVTKVEFSSFDFHTANCKLLLANSKGSADSFICCLLLFGCMLLASIFRVVGMRPVDETSGGSGAKLREVAMAARRDESQKRNRNFVAAIAV